jgi:hypothetical protein
MGNLGIRREVRGGTPGVVESVECVLGGFVGNSVVLFGGHSGLPQTAVNQIEMVKRYKEFLLKKKRWLERLANCGIIVKK